VRQSENEICYEIRTMRIHKTSSIATEAWLEQTKDLVVLDVDRMGHEFCVVRSRIFREVWVADSARFLWVKAARSAAFWGLVPVGFGVSRKRGELLR
jgi:hypothetical protein